MLYAFTQLALMRAYVVFRDVAFHPWLWLELGVPVTQGMTDGRWDSSW